MGDVALPLLHHFQTIVCYRALEMFRMDQSVDGDLPASGR